MRRFRRFDWLLVAANIAVFIVMIFIMKRANDDGDTVGVIAAIAVIFATDGLLFEYWRSRG